MVYVLYGMVLVSNGEMDADSFSDSTHHSSISFSRKTSLLQVLNLSWSKGAFVFRVLDFGDEIWHALSCFA